MTAITFDRAAGTRSTLGATLVLDVRRTLRNRRYLMFSVAFPVVFYLLYTGSSRAAILRSGSTAPAGARSSWSPWPPTAPSGRR